MSTKDNEMLDMFRKSGFSPSPVQLDLFKKYYALLIKYNDELDLTRLKSFDDIVIKHFIDSVYITKYIDLPSPLLDIGTGAGFPGIPLKILNPGLELILAEPRKKRVSFLQLVIRELELSNIEIFPHMVTDKSFFTARGVITRALESIDETLTRAGHFLKSEGRVILMKGPEAGEDMLAVSQENLDVYTLEMDREYTLPFTNYGRRVIVYKKRSPETRWTYAILKDESRMIGTPITSGENKKFKELKKILSPEGIRKTGGVLISGKKIIVELLTKKALPVVNLVLHDGYAEEDDYMNDVIAGLHKSGKLIILKKSLYNEIDLFNTGGPLLAVQVPEIPEWDMTAVPGCTLLIPFQDPVNVGSAIRSAAGFGVKKVVVLKEAAHPYHPKSIRSSAGAVFGVTILKGPSLSELPEKLAGRADILALDKNGTPLSSYTFPDRFLLLPGIEGPGLPSEFRGQSVSIPLLNDVESLNAPVAVSIALYEWSRSYSPSN